MSGAKGAAVALVTGAARGQGRAIAVALGRAGARVAALDINPDGAERIASAIALEGGVARAEAADVSNKLAVQTMLYDVLEAWERIDILVNAAHVTPASAALKLDEWEWNRTVDVNLKGAFLLAQTVARAMQSSGGGLILNVVRPEAASAHVAVRAARAGLLGLTGALQDEWRLYGIQVEALEEADAAAAAEVALRRCAEVLQNWR